MEERRQEILRRLESAGRVSVADLSQLFGVSEVTVRSDLQALAEQDLIVRTHGGAVLQDMALSHRRQQHIQEKSDIGQAAASLVEEGDAIYLDGSSTALAIAQNLKSHRRIMVITSGIALIQELFDAPGVNIVSPAGIVQRDTASLIDPDGLAYLDKFNIQKGFFGAHGLALPEGLTDISVDVAAVKRPLVQRCRQVIAVIDATKWGRVGVASFARMEDVNIVVTDRHAPPNLVEEVRALGVKVVLV